MKLAQRVVSQAVDPDEEEQADDYGDNRSKFTISAPRNIRHQTSSAQQDMFPPYFNDQGSSNTRPVNTQQMRGQTSRETFRQENLHRTMDNPPMVKVQMGNKDLIIRMLAEVFHVSHSDDGQVRWKQLSTSLVPVSLYSRTTSKWLDYLLTGSTLAAANDPANAMSPDSREFLLLMQQYHQNQLTTDCQDHKIAQQMFAESQQAQKECIVFQVIGHDFIDGRCKKILNVKIVQPGTRLGRASDYFVYWKEQTTQVVSRQTRLNHPINLQMQQQISSSFASSSSFAQSQNLIDSNIQQNNRSFLADSSVATMGTHTWGLNFASINDAKLFHDICSLNLVQLDFNSEYLKQLALSDRLRCQNIAPNPRTSYRQMISPFTKASTSNREERQKVAKRPQRQTSSNRQHQLILNTDSKSRLPTRESSRLSRCPTCRQSTIDCNTKVRSTTIRPGDENFPVDTGACRQHRSVAVDAGFRTRSRSSTKNPTSAFGSRGAQTDNLRARSFSTPASPDPMCPVHRGHKVYQGVPNDREQATSYHLIHNENYKRQAPSFVAPVSKPARGFLRADLNADRNDHHMRFNQEPFVYQSASSQPTYRYSQSGQGGVRSIAGHLPTSNETSAKSVFPPSVPRGDHRSGSVKKSPLEYQTFKLSNHRRTRAAGAQDSYSPEQYVSSQTPMRQYLDDQASKIQEVSNMVSNIENMNMMYDFDTIEHKDARLARARYANSKNMKEFLSLDAGGFQSIPNGSYSRHQATTSKTKFNSSAGRERSKEKNQTRAKMDYGAPEVEDSSRKTTRDSSGKAQANPNSEIIKKGAETNDADSQTKEHSQDPTRNVSTNTDDLPDETRSEQARHNLASEKEVGQGEKRGSLRVDNDNFVNKNEDISTMKANQDSRQTRAVSLGLEGEQGSIRGRETRSDTGRRRSLERSMGVDFDSSFPASAFKKFTRLSPLPQLVSPMAQDSAKSPNSDGANVGEKSPECECNPIASEVAELDETQQNRQDVENTKIDRLSPTGDIDGENFRDRTSPKDFSRCSYASHDQMMVQKGVSSEKKRHDGPKISSMQIASSIRDRSDLNQIPMSSFKSVPNISRLSEEHEIQARDLDSNKNLAPNDQGLEYRYEPSSEGEEEDFALEDDSKEEEFASRVQTRYHTHDGRAMIRNSQGTDHRKDSGVQTMPKKMATMSSYAVPLCSSRRALQTPARQCRSCPNSLRRKRRLSNHEVLVSPHYGQAHASSRGTVGEWFCQHCCQATDHLATMRRDHTGMHLRDSQTLDGIESALGKQTMIRDEQLRNLQLSEDNSEYFGNAFACCQCHSPASYYPHESYRCQQPNPTLEKERRIYCTGPQTTQRLHKHRLLAQPHLDQVSSHTHRHRCHPSEPYHPPIETFGAHHNSDCLLKHTRPRSSAQSTPQPSYRPLIEQEESMIALNGQSFQTLNQPHLAGEQKRYKIASRSPLHYGLYESECEDEEVEEICSQPMRDIAACCQGKSFPRSTSANLKEMYRSHDSDNNSRQRSRSQPPANKRASGIGNTSAIIQDGQGVSHVTKSMENVEKLIKEVQNELDTLRRYPVGSVLIDMRHKDQGGNSSTHGGRSDKFRKESGGEYGTQVVNELSRPGLESLSMEAEKTKLSTTSATRRAGQFKCVGAIRKAGFLSVKKWIIKRKQSIELARRQGWKRYWVCLRGTALLFHSIVDAKPESYTEAQARDQQIDLTSWIQENLPSHFGELTNLAQEGALQKRLDEEQFRLAMSHCYIEREPKHLIIIDGAIAQPIPEHPRRDFVFCLSTTFGDAYFFQAEYQVEADNWIAAIHNACAASIARDLTRDDTIKLFETKIRHLELEAEKKFFLRQRLESRLSSMLSISGPDLIDETTSIKRIQMTGLIGKDKHDNSSNDKVTMRSLFYQLSQQLLALDSYIEQVHCEVYQLKCYLSSCNSQSLFYQNMQLQNFIGSGLGSGSNNPAQSTNCDLPHPKSLLMHVSKPTKLLLLKLGVFTVSSFHAYIHASHGSTDNILQGIRKQASGNVTDQSREQQPSETLELRIRPQSISESLLSRPENQKLESKTEELIELSNLETVRLQLTKDLFNKIRDSYLSEVSTDGNKKSNEEYLVEMEGNTSDDRYSVRDGGDMVIINLKLNPNTNSSSVIKQALKIVEPRSTDQLEFLNYYLRLISIEQREAQLQGPQKIVSRQSDDYYIVKRRDAVKDWPPFNYVELVEKSIFRIGLQRSSTDEEASLPFGISIEGQLFSNSFDSILSVYCSYVEWGSVAEKAGLKEEDEFLMFNGMLVPDLDLMFVECLLLEAKKLCLVIRSCRSDRPEKALSLERNNWQLNGSDDDDDDDNEYDHKENDALRGLGLDSTAEALLVAGGSQIVTDEYLTSLVCPPPPGHSSGFIRSDQHLLRQKSDLGQSGLDAASRRESDYSKEGDSRISRSRSQFGYGSLSGYRSDGDNEPHIGRSEPDILGGEPQEMAGSFCLATQLVQETERLTKMVETGLGTTVAVCNKDDSLTQTNSESEVASNQRHAPLADFPESHHHNSLERLKKSLLELLETEYAYVKQLEAMNDRYMNPLMESEFLNILPLRHSSQALIELLEFQRNFFRALVSEMMTALHVVPTDNNDDYERLNSIVLGVEDLDAFDSRLQMVLEAISQIFVSEAERFKVYATYCIAYSKLQRVLHPRTSSGDDHCSSSITSMPSALNTFSSALISSSSGHLHAKDHSSFPLRQISAFITSTSIATANISEQVAQLKLLTDFLGNLDSSSSSVSFSSLARSSSTLITGDINGRSSEKEENPRKRKFKLTYEGLVKNGSSNSLVNEEQLCHQRSVHQQNFESYLIKPIQRIVKYPMLLSSISTAAECLASRSYVDNHLQPAIKHMEAAVTEVNARQKIHDEYGAVLEQIGRQYMYTCVSPNHDVNNPRGSQAFPRLTGSSSTLPELPISMRPEQPSISLDIGNLLYFGSVDWLNIHEFTSKVKRAKLNLSQVLFVFPSCVIFIAKERIRSGKKRTSALKSNEGVNKSLDQITSGTSNQGQMLMGFMSSNLYQGLSASNGPYTEVIRYQTLIPVSEVQVRSLPMASCKQEKTGDTCLRPQYRWELFHRTNSLGSKHNVINISTVNQGSGVINQVGSAVSMKQRSGYGKNSRVYRLACRSNEERSTFLRKIRSTIRDSVRNMSLPQTKCASSVYHQNAANNDKLSSPVDINSTAISTATSSHTSSASSPSKNIGHPQTPSSQTNATSNSTFSQASNFQNQTDSCGMAELQAASSYGGNGPGQSRVQLETKSTGLFETISQIRQLEKESSINNGTNRNNNHDKFSKESIEVTH